MMWWNGAQWYWAIAMMIFFFAVVVAVCYFAVHRGPGERSRPSARELLDERLARGELSEDEYARRRGALEGHSSEPHG